ncbi:MAG TPA: MGMT family protein [Capillibacterium sp.]
MDGFFQQVYQIVAQIPAGRVATYGQIAALIGEPRSARIVGWALHSAPRQLNLPCHRVVNKKGTLCPADLFGPGRQRLLLEAEGVTFTPDGRVNMEKHLWDPFARLKSGPEFTP